MNKQEQIMQLIREWQKEDEEKRRKFLSNGLTKSDLIGIIINRENDIERLVKTLSDVKKENESKQAEYEEKIREVMKTHGETDDSIDELISNYGSLVKAITLFVLDLFFLSSTGVNVTS